MKRIDFGQTMQIIANLGVIAGILLLAYELRQNNALMQAEARFNRLTVVTDAWRSLAEDGELTELRARAANDEALSPVEQRRVDAAVMRVLLNLEWIYKELPEGSSELNAVRVNQQRNFENDATYRRVWDDRKTAFDPAFVRWMEEDVVP